MPFNTQYIASNTIQEVFRDKDTGLPLRFGYVLFTIDTQRTIGNPVYKITGSPPNYTYIPFGFLDINGKWRVTLTNEGTFQETIYYLPFDANGNQQLYFVEVFSASNVFQYSREGWPNVDEGEISNISQVAYNYVPNGQFLLHTNVPALNPTFVEGQIRAPITNVAYGGWTFQRPSTSTALDIVLFEDFGNYITNPIGSPRYSIRINTQTPFPGDSFKYLSIQWNDVNKFASTAQQFTFSFTAQVNSGSGLNIGLDLIKFFGTGGSATTDIPITTFSIGTSWTQYTFSFSFGNNLGKTIGSNNDDYVSLVLSFPVNSSFDISFVDFILAQGKLTTPVYPVTTNAQDLYKSMAGGLAVPDYNAFNLGLPVILTQTGLGYDNSIVGKVFPAFYISPQFGELFCDGSQYETSAYSSDGIPFYRLQQVLTSYSANNLGIPLFGTGFNYVLSNSVYGNISQDQFIIANNNNGVVASTSDGSTPTGFIFYNIYTAIASPYNVTGLISSSNTIPDNAICYIYGIYFAGIFGPGIVGAGTSGFTVLILRNTPDTKFIISLTPAPVGGLAGKYLQFASVSIQYFIWFTVDGIGTQPVVAGTPIRINLTSNMNSADIANIIAFALNGGEETLITINALPPASSFFNFDTPGSQFYVWYTVDGIGIDPKPVGRLPISVNILSTYSTAQVRSATATAINSKYFAVPDLRGITLKGYDPTFSIDPVARTSRIPLQELGLFQLGTFEFDGNLEHLHPFSYTQKTYTLPYGGSGRADGGDTLPSLVEADVVVNSDTGYEGDRIVSVVNTAVNYVIKY
jgi:hypothetical protein